MYSTQIDGIDIIEHPKDEQRIGPPIAWHMWKHMETQQSYMYTN